MDTWLVNKWIVLAINSAKWISHTLSLNNHWVEIVKLSMQIHVFYIITDIITVGPDEVTIVGPQNDTLIAGERDKFLTCKADCSPSCTYTWYKNGRHVSRYRNGYGYSWINGPQLIFRPTIRITDTGNYSCQARNRIAVVNISTPWYIRVLGKNTKHCIANVF